MSLDEELEEKPLEEIPQETCEHDYEPFGEEGWSGGTYITAGRRCRKCGDEIPGGWGTNAGAM
jgi:hypothetical protein